MKIASLGGMLHFFFLHSILAALVRHIYLILIWLKVSPLPVEGVAEKKLSLLGDGRQKVAISVNEV